MSKLCHLPPTIDTNRSLLDATNPIIGEIPEGEINPSHPWGVQRTGEATERTTDAETFRPMNGGRERVRSNGPTIPQVCYGFDHGQFMSFHYCG